jgi:uncharacterized membrane protein YiaA
MLNNGSEEREESLKRELVEHPEVLEVVEERKKRRFLWSGLLLAIIGVVLIAVGLVLNTGINSIESLFIGVGALIVIIGVLRILIGLIRPIVPSQL